MFVDKLQNGDGVALGMKRLRATYFTKQQRLFGRGMETVLLNPETGTVTSVRY